MRVRILNSVHDTTNDGQTAGHADSEPLYDPPNKDDVVHLLSMVTDWYSVGLKLGLSTAELDEIKYGGRPSEQKKSFAVMWLDAAKRRGEPPSWERLRTVLAELKMVRAVESINKRYRPGEKCEYRRPFPKLSDRPTMAQLHCIQGTNEQCYRIIQECAGQWEMVADLLLPDSSLSVTREIERDPCLPHPYDKCRAVFEKWLDSQSSMTLREPVTWNELLAVLHDLEKSVLASDLKKYVIQQV